MVSGMELLAFVVLITVLGAFAASYGADSRSDEPTAPAAWDGSDTEDHRFFAHNHQ